MECSWDIGWKNGLVKRWMVSGEVENLKINRARLLLVSVNES